MAPFTPFLTEHMYQNLRRCQGGDSDANTDSVHYCDIPAATEPQPADQHIQQVCLADLCFPHIVESMTIPERRS